MAPIRVGLIGLSTTSQSTSWASRAHLPYLQSPQGKKHYEIVAICNSSVASAQKSIEHYKLPSSIKAYDSAADLARDPDVDLVVNVTGVERHHELLLPVVQQGCNVYTELPLASNMDQMKELLETAEKKGIKTVFGMQGQTSPVTKVVREIIASGKIGKVFSSTWTGSGMTFGEKPMAIGLRSFLERKAGANMMTVGFLHSMNYIMSTLGEIEAFQSILGNQMPSVQLMDPAQDEKIVETAPKDTPDQILIQGRFESGAIFSYHLRSGDLFPGQKGVTWEIYGEKGAILITCPVFMLDIMHGGISIKLQTAGKEGAEDIELPEDDLSDLPHPCQNVGRIYEAYAKGEQGEESGYPDWKVAMKRHELMEDMFKRSDGYTSFGEPVNSA